MTILQKQDHRPVPTSPAAREEIVTLWFEFPEETTGTTATVKCRPHVQSKPNTLSPNWVPVYKKIVNITLTKTIKCKRKQFPCVPACAITIHKSQGGTFAVIVYKYSSKQPQQLAELRGRAPNVCCWFTQYCTISDVMSLTYF